MKDIYCEGKDYKNQVNKYINKIIVSFNKIDKGKKYEGEIQNNQNQRRDYIRLSIILFKVLLFFI